MKRDFSSYECYFCKEKKSCDEILQAITREVTRIRKAKEKSVQKAGIAV